MQYEEHSTVCVKSYAKLVSVAMACDESDHFKWTLKEYFDVICVNTRKQQRYWQKMIISRNVKRPVNVSSQISVWV